MTKLLKTYVGLACSFRDPAVAIVDAHGEIRFAEATERPLRTKKASACVPDQLVGIGHILDQHVPSGSEIVVAVPWSRRYAFWTQALTPVRSVAGLMANHFPQWRHAVDAFRLIADTQSSLLAMTGKSLVYRFRYSGGAFSEVAAKSPRRIDMRRFDHHEAHAAAGCLTSPFEDAVCAVVDGFGENSGASFFRYSKGEIRKLKQPQNGKASLGVFYMSLCEACGFDPLQGEEWKVMGLAPYGTFDKQAYEFMRSALSVDGLSLRGTRMYDSRFWKTLQDLYPREILAHNGQRVFEECTLALLRNLHQLTKARNLVLGGGCALNSVCNGRVLEETDFESLYVFCAPADDGNAVGSALLAWKQDNPGIAPHRSLQTPFLGSELPADGLRRLARVEGLRVRELGHKVYAETARLLAAGRVVAWVQGRAEFGPRALGNRSILLDPRRADGKALLNERVKFREPFRPFAPAILAEYGDRYFEEYQDSPYMERALRFRPEVQASIPAVVHVDGTGRVQSVKREWNPAFHALLSEFHSLTGVPLLLNTSLNVMGEPIVHDLGDALNVLMLTDVDVLVVGQALLEKSA